MSKKPIKILVKKKRREKRITLWTPPGLPNNKSNASKKMALVKEINQVNLDKSLMGYFDLIGTKVVHWDFKYSIFLTETDRKPGQ